ncbi:MAG: Rne/Rng family ribonuclease [Planctomycetota bacterium]
MLINATDPEEARIAVVENGVLLELHVEIAGREAYLGNIYKGRVVNIEPSIGAAFVAFGGRTNGFLHASDVLPAYARPDFKLEDVVEGRARVSGDEGPDAVRAILDDSDDDDDDDQDDGGADGAAEADAKKGRRGRRPGRGRSRSEAEEDAESTADSHDSAADGEDDADEGRDADGVVEASAGAGHDEFGIGAAGDGDSHDDSHDDVHDDSHDEGAEAVGAADDGGPGHADEESAAAGEDADEDGDDAADQGASEASGGEGGEARRRSRRRRRRGRGGEEAPAEVASESVEARGKSRRGAARRSKTPIDQMLRKGQEVIVQVTKEGIGAKGPTLTTFVSLPGRCLVLMPSLPKCGVSRKIDDARERRRLKRIVKDLDETGNGGVGFIVRTAGVEKSKADLQRDRDYLKKIWELIAQRVQVTRAPSVLYQESDLVLKAMRDLFSPEIEEVVVDSRDVYLRIKDFCEKLMPHMAERVKLHELTTPLFHSYGLESEVEKLYQPKVELPNGGSIVIEQAEALVAIDVNSGRFKPGTELEDTAFRTNLEAIPEIVRQLRLRDLGGLIMIDFIDMGQERHRRQIERRIVEALRGDRARIKVGRISPFGMLEVTRQRVGPGLKHTVFMTCRHCNGSGLTRTVQSKALAVLREVKAILGLKGFSVLQVFVSPPVNDYLVNYKRRPILDLEEAVGKSVVFKAEPSYPVDVVHYRFMTGDGQEARVAIPAGLGVKA